MSMLALMSRDALLVVTLKFIHGSKVAQRLEMAERFMDSLKPHFKDIRMEWLYSNQMLERTILARRRSDVDNN